MWHCEMHTAAAAAENPPVQSTTCTGQLPVRVDYLYGSTVTHSELYSLESGSTMLLVKYEYILGLDWRSWRSHRNSEETLLSAELIITFLWELTGSPNRYYDRLCSNASTMLLATGQVNGTWRNLIPYRYRIETPEPLVTKFSTIDYVHDRTT